MRVTLPERAPGGQPVIAAFAGNVVTRRTTSVLGPVLARVLGPEPAGAPTTTGMEVLREFIPAVAG